MNDLIHQALQDSSEDVILVSLHALHEFLQRVAIITITPSPNEKVSMISRKSLVVE